MQVYLCGPITGLKKSEVDGWRHRAYSLLSPFALVIDPARSDYDTTIAFQTHEDRSKAMRRLRHGRFVVDRNKNLIRHCDVVLANLLGAQRRVSVGCVGEIFWADAFGKPVVIVRDARGNIHDHAMLNAIASEICTDLETACDILAKMAAVSDATTKTTCRWYAQQES